MLQPRMIAWRQTNQRFSPETFVVKAAQATADAALAGVTATNERITAIDDHEMRPAVRFSSDSRSPHSKNHKQLTWVVIDTSRR
jgi:hypothetical protein